ncbi:hypothetical protein PJP13_29770, partial [Mycobacterium kansasii]
MFMANTRTSPVVGKGKVLLERLTLNDILHVLDIRRNLVSGLLLNKAGFKLVFDLDKL